jgi:hypothetical protein
MDLTFHRLIDLTDVSLLDSSTIAGWVKSGHAALRSCLLTRFKGEDAAYVTDTLAYACVSDGIYGVWTDITRLNLCGKGDPLNVRGCVCEDVRRAMAKVLVQSMPLYGVAAKMGHPNQPNATAWRVERAWTVDGRPAPVPRTLAHIVADAVSSPTAGPGYASVACICACRIGPGTVHLALELLGQLHEGAVRSRGVDFLPAEPQSGVGEAFRAQLIEELSVYNLGRVKSMDAAISDMSPPSPRARSEDAAISDMSPSPRARSEGGPAAAAEEAAAEGAEVVAEVAPDVHTDFDSDDRPWLPARRGAPRRHVNAFKREDLRSLHADVVSALVRSHDRRRAVQEAVEHIWFSPARPQNHSVCCEPDPAAGGGVPQMRRWDGGQWVQVPDAMRLCRSMLARTATVLQDFLYAHPRLANTTAAQRRAFTAALDDLLKTPDATEDALATIQRLSSHVVVAALDPGSLQSLRCPAPPPVYPPPPTRPKAPPPEPQPFGGYGTMRDAIDRRARERAGHRDADHEYIIYAEKDE